MFHNIANLFDSLVTATYVVGFFVVGAAIWQFRRAFKLNKKSDEFKELSKDTQKAFKLISDITTKAQSIVMQLASAANTNSAPFDVTGKTQAQIQTEIDRRVKLINETADKHQEYIQAIHDGYTEIIQLIKKIEKSTVVGDDSRKAARYLFYAAQEQNNFVNTLGMVLRTFRVNPPLGQLPNVSSDTFNEFNKLIELIVTRNQLIGSYIEDLEVILHNDLVKRLFGKAKPTTVNMHLTPNGFTDKRVDKSLI